MPLFNRKTVILLSTLLVNRSTFAQTEATPPVEMADALYQSGKIYVVITSVALIFIGITIYLILIDRKLGKLEKELKKN